MLFVHSWFVISDEHCFSKFPLSSISIVIREDFDATVFGTWMFRGARVLENMRIFIFSSVFFDSLRKSPCSFSNVTVVAFLILAIVFVNKITLVFLIGDIFHSKISRQF